MKCFWEHHWLWSWVSGGNATRGCTKGPGETGSKLWLLLSFLLSTLGGKLPCSIGWLIGEVLGKISGGIVTRAGAIGEDMRGLKVGAFLWGGIGCMDGGKFLSAVDGAGTALYGGVNDLVLGLGLGDMDTDGSILLIFWRGGADALGGYGCGFEELCFCGLWNEGTKECCFLFPAHLTSRYVHGAALWSWYSYLHTNCFSLETHTGEKKNYQNKDAEVVTGCRCVILVG